MSTTETIRPALFFTDNGRVLCEDHLGATAAATRRDISGQRILAVPDELRSEIDCETCRVRPVYIVERSDDLIAYEGPTRSTAVIVAAKLESAGLGPLIHRRNPGEPMAFDAESTAAAFRLAEGRAEA